MSRSLVLLLGTFVMLLPVLMNGGPFVYFDTASYLSRPDKAIGVLAEVLGFDAPSLFDPVGEDGEAGSAVSAREADPGYRVGGRSVFYGLPMWASAALGSPGAVAVIQAALTVALLHLVWDMLPAGGSPLGRGAELIGVIGFLAVATPAGIFAGLLMPDAFAPLTILSIALLVCAWSALGRTTRVGVALLLTFSLAAHTSHLLVAVGMILFGAALCLAVPAARTLLSRRGLALCTAAAAAAIAAGLAAETAARQLTGIDTISRPHLTAHLVDDGPGALWVARNCSGTGETAAERSEMAVCAFQDRIPADWIAFLFDASPERGAFQASDAPSDLRRALSEEDLAFALGVLRDDPVRTAAFMIEEFRKQLISVRYDDVPLAGRTLQDRIQAFPADLVHSEGGRIASDPVLLSALSRLAEVTAVVGAVALLIGVVVLLGVRGSANGTETLLWVTGAVILGVVLNAAVCGMLASPYDRFQSRVVFLIPAFALAIWSALSRASISSSSHSMTHPVGVAE